MPTIAPSRFLQPGVVAVLAQLKTQLLAVLRVQQVLAEVAHLGVGLFVNPDQTDLTRDPLLRGSES